MTTSIDDHIIEKSITNEIITIFKNEDSQKSLYTIMNDQLRQYAQMICSAVQSYDVLGVAATASLVNAQRNYDLRRDYLTMMLTEGSSAELRDLVQEAESKLTRALEHECRYHELRETCKQIATSSNPLGLGSWASAADAKKAYRSLVTQVHPDVLKAFDGRLEKAGNAATRTLNVAYERYRS